MYLLNTKIRLTMQRLSGFELCSCWVPLIPHTDSLCACIISGVSVSKFLTHPRPVTENFKQHIIMLRKKSQNQICTRCGKKIAALN